MDPLSGIGGGATTASASNAFSALSSEEFVKIIFTELAHQDPLAPNDSKALLEQLSSIRNIQSDLELSNKLESLVAQNQMSAAAGLIGRKVSGVSLDYERVEGVVTSVIRTTQGAVLRLASGAFIHMDNLDQVLETPVTPPTTNPPTNPPANASTSTPRNGGNA